MGLLETIVGYFDRATKKEKMEAPDGICPNCWGKQKYDKKIRLLVEDKQVSVNNKSANHAFIQDFVVTNLNGIKLKKNNTNYECPSCKVSTPIR